jgi:hypothetical protein
MGGQSAATMSLAFFSRQKKFLRNLYFLIGCLISLIRNSNFHFQSERGSGTHVAKVASASVADMSLSDKYSILNI